MEQMIWGILPTVIGAIVAIITITLLLKLYRTNPSNEAFVRTGLGKEKVVTNGAIVLPPPLHKITRVNLSSIQMPMQLEGRNALTTNEFLKVDLDIVCNVKVKKDAESILKNAVTLGDKTFEEGWIKDFLGSKLNGALRNTVASLKIDELQQNRETFIGKFKESVEADLSANGFELETVTINKLTQTNINFFETNNVFDERGITIVTQMAELKKRERFNIEQETKVQIAQKDLESTEKTLELERQKQEKQAKQEREIAEFEAEQRRQAEEARINSEKAIEMAEKQKEIALKEQEIANEKAAEEKEIEKAKAIEIAKQDKAISIQNKSKEESLAKAEADKARAEAMTQEQNVITVEAVAKAERQARIEVIDAKKVAERDAVKIKVAAQTEKEAAEDKAKAILTEAQAKADAKRIEAEAEANQVKIKTEAEAQQVIEMAKANEEKYKVEAEGKRLLIEAKNGMNEAQLKLQQLETIMSKLPEIVRESAKPMENIESIKLVGGVGMNGFANTTQGNESVGEGKNTSLVDQVFDGALKYQTNRTLMSEVMKGVGIDNSSLEGLQKPILDTLKDIKN